MLTKDYQHFALLFHTKKGERNIAKDLTLEIYENTDVATQVLSEYFSSCRYLFRTTAQITHLDYPGANKAVKDLTLFLRDSERQETIDLMRNWIATSSPEKHVAISGFVFTGLKKALAPQKILHCPVVNQFPLNLGVKTLSKVEVSGGWVREILDGDSCPLLGCVPIGDEYVSWKLYPEATFVPILGIIDFCRHQKVLSLVEEWFQKYSDSPESKVLRAINQIENVEIIRDSLFV